MLKVKVTTEQAPGALANGTRVVKAMRWDNNEFIPVGTYATILGSLRLLDDTLLYCLKYDGIELPVYQVYLPGRFRVVDSTPSN